MTTAATKPPPLFAKPIPVIGATGDFGSGKTRFICSIAPGPATLLFDSEKSSESYEEIGMKRVGIPEEMVKRKPNGYSQLDVFEWWLATCKGIPAGKYRVIGLDVAEDIEEGLAEWVWQNPLKFNHTRNQYLNASGIYWGDVKSYWKQILLDICSRCEIFAFAVHLGSVWGQDKKPTGAKKPKGKSTLMQLASLFIQIERPIQPDGSRQEVPSARVLKTRLSHNTVVNGSLITKEILPPRLPEATPEAIRAYIAKPCDYSRLSVAEKAAPVLLSQDERAQIRLATAQAEAQTEQLRIERMQTERQAAGNSGQEVSPPTEMTPPTFDDEAVPSNGEPVSEPVSEPTATTSQTADGTTLQEALAGSDQAEFSPAVEPTIVDPAISPTSPAPAPIRHRDPDIHGEIIARWEEFCHLKNLSDPAVKSSLLLQSIQKRFGADKTGLSSITSNQKLELENAIIDRLKVTYKELGLACPF